MSDDRTRRVPKRVAKYHPALRQTIDALGPSIRFGGGLLYSGGAGCVRLKLAPAQKARALRLLHVLFLEAEKRGWELKPARDGRKELAIVKAQHVCPFSLKVHTRRVAVEKPEREWSPRFDFVPTDVLRLELDAAYGARREFKDGVRKRLEDRLDEILDSIASYFDLCVVRDAEWAAAELERHARWEREEERRRLQAVELERDRVARQLLADWRDARDMRIVIAEVRTSRGCDGADGSWLQWLEEWSNRIDPIQSRPSDPCQAAGGSPAE